MTQPLPDAAAQRQAALEVYTQYEPALYAAYLDMISQWLAEVRAAMFAGGVVSLGLMPDPLTVFTQAPAWASLVTQYTEQVVRNVLAEPYRQLGMDETIFDSRPYVRNFVVDRVNKMRNTPNEVYGLVRTIVDSATTNGASIPDVTQQIGELLDATNGDRWPGRAAAVARTEVVGAYNGGLHDAFGVLVNAMPDRTYMKRWLSTVDRRTRPDHVEADGQLVSFAQPFIVGGFPMMHPHDPAGPPQEVINCRCTELLELEGEPTPMDNRQYLDASGQTLARYAFETNADMTNTDGSGWAPSTTGVEPGTRLKDAADKLGRAMRKRQRQVGTRPVRRPHEAEIPWDRGT